MPVFQKDMPLFYELNLVFTNLNMVFYFTAIKQHILRQSDIVLHTSYQLIVIENSNTFTRCSILKFEHENDFNFKGMTHDSSPKGTY